MKEIRLFINHLENKLNYTENKLNFAENLIMAVQKNMNKKPILDTNYKLYEKIEN